MILPRFLIPLAVLAGAGAVSAQTFSVPGFIEEDIYQGNGMISMAFDHEDRLFVTEKQGRILLFKPNTDAEPLSFAYQYFEGTWTQVPDFSALTPLGTGTVTTMTAEVPGSRADNYGLRYTGTLNLPTAGTYTFYTRSDDGSLLHINGTLVVDNDGLHGNVEESGTITLAAGSHAITVDYIEAGGGQSLEVSFEGPTMPKQIIGANSGPFLPPVVFADYVALVNADAERGLLGLALDPDFANNRHLFILYSTDTDQRIVRLTANATFDAVEPGSELILLSGLPNANPVHKAGDIHFRPGDPYRLYVALGDDGDRYIVGDLDLYAGKLLRIDTSTGQGVPDNPHWDGDPDSVRSRIWAHRFRNPFRFAFDPADEAGDAIYISENGDGTDRVARIEIGADGGWDPLFLTDSADGKRTILHTTAPSLTAIAFLRGGPFAPDGPVIYNARYGGNDRKEVRRWRVTGENLDVITPFPEDNGNAFLSGFTAFNIVSFTHGPDGALYYTDSNQGDSTGTGYRLGRIRYVGGEPPAVAFSAETSAPSGEAPLTVQFTDASTSAGTIAAWSWNFGDGSTSTAPSPEHTYTTPGVYTVTLTVTDNVGLTATETTTITVVHLTQLRLHGAVLDARAPRAVPLAAATELRLYQADGVTPLVFAGGVGDDGNALTVAAGGLFDATVNVGLTGPGIVVSAGEPAADGVGEALAGFALSLSETAQEIETTYRLAPAVVTGRVVDTLGQPAALDLGVSRGDPAHPYPVSGYGGSHRVLSDPLGYYHVAVRAGEADATFTLDTAGELLAGTHGRTRVSFTLAEGESLRRDVVVGLYDGADGEDDLSGQAVTPDVDFAAQVQPIFNSLCVACHNDIATNSGGLDLQSGASLSELVGRISVEAKGVMLVDPGHPERSYLMEKLGSDNPQVGTRMRPGNAIDLALQALVRDWIAQLEPTPDAFEAWRLAAFGEFAGEPEALAAADFDGDGLSNLFEYALGSSPVTADGDAVRPQLAVVEESGERYLTLTVARDPDAEGLAWLVEASEDLAEPTAWTAVETITLTDTPSLLVVRDTVPLSETPRRFLRARVTTAE
ncbi:MAG: PQQ-dependent sugar dehydrogenase [Verrucomicrobiota bacterium]